jgi:hypothetical protein
MPDPSEESQHTLFQKVAERSAQKPIERQPPPRPLRHQPQPAFYQAGPQQNSTAGFYLFMAIIGLILLGVGGVYLTRKQNQQPQVTINRLATALPPPATPAPDVISAPVPPAQQPQAPSPIQASAPAAPSASSSSGALIAPAANSDAVPFPVPSAPAPITGPSVFPANPPSQSINQSLSGDNANSSSVTPDDSASPSSQGTTSSANPVSSANPSEVTNPSDPADMNGASSAPDAASTPAPAPSGP